MIDEPVSMECWLTDTDRVKTDVLGEKLVPIPICSSQVPHGCEMRV